MVVDVCVGEICGTCACCRDKRVSDDVAFATPAAAREAARRTSRAAAVSKLCRPVGYAVQAHKRQRTNIARDRLCGFLKLLAKLDSAPWASTVFDVNDRMIRVLTATHLHLITGKDHFKKADRPALLAMIDSGRNLDGLGNVVWITNRQQGKVRRVAVPMKCPNSMATMSTMLFFQLSPMYSHSPTCCHSATQNSVDCIAS